MCVCVWLLMWLCVLGFVYGRSGLFVCVCTYGYLCACLCMCLVTCLVDRSFVVCLWLRVMCVCFCVFACACVCLCGVG